MNGKSLSRLDVKQIPYDVWVIKRRAIMYALNFAVGKLVANWLAVREGRYIVANWIFISESSSPAFSSLDKFCEH